jgi:hypothetical protein
MTTTAPTLDATLTRTVAALERVEADLKSIDLRSLPTKSHARTAIRDLRADTKHALAQAKVELKASRP